MYSAEAKSLSIEPVAEPGRRCEYVNRWEDFPYSRLSHHGTACCELAREWVIAMDFAQLGGANLVSGPLWLRIRFKWGPSSWPMHWCEVVERDTLDCGAHAALACTAFTARGLAAFPVQLVQTYSAEAGEHWHDIWAAENVSCHWLDGDHIYHEATGVVTGANELGIWDGSTGSWVNALQSGGGYGSLVALRVLCGQAAGQADLSWGSRTIKTNRWNQLLG
jgi:hypothetical protein